MIPRLTLLLSCGFAIAEPGSASPAGSDLPKGQRGAPAEWVVDPQQSELHYEIQRAPKGELALTPNEAFFPKLGLEATGAGAFPDDPKWNKGESFSEIGKWDRGDAAEWGLWFEKAGVLTVDLDSSSQLADASRISFGEEVIDARGQARLAVKRPGLHVLRFECTGDPGAAAVFRSIRIQVSAEAAAGAGVVRKRWRPAAAHARFRSDRANGSKTRLWIMEMDAVPGSLDFYAPITTPFGYYGPTWNADGTVGSSFNFSLWSYGRGKEAPPLDKLSHLLAIGHRDATFGGYGHEGTGVKIRDWKPLEGRSGQRQVLALRLEPGGPG